MAIGAYSSGHVTIDHPPAHHWAQRPHPQTEHRVRTYLGFGEIRRPSPSLGWVAADAIWVGGHFAPLVSHVCLSPSGHAQLRSHSTCLQGECAALGMKAAVCVDRKNGVRGGGSSLAEGALLPDPPSSRRPSHPLQTTPDFLGPLQSGLKEATVSCW